MWSTHVRPGRNCFWDIAGRIVHLHTVLVIQHSSVQKFINYIFMFGLIHVHCSAQFYRFLLFSIRTKWLEFKLFVCSVFFCWMWPRADYPVHKWLQSGPEIELVVHYMEGAGGIAAPSWPTVGEEGGGQVSLAWDIDSITQQSSPTLPCLQVMCHNFSTLEHIQKFISVKGTRRGASRCL